MRILTVSAVWDDEADVWVACSDDVPGLITEADTFTELRTKLLDLIPELLAENGHLTGQSSFST
jgi:predicted RNase H-like HicB family nuclease